MSPLELLAMGVPGAAPGASSPAAGSAPAAGPAFPPPPVPAGVPEPVEDPAAEPEPANPFLKKPTRAPLDDEEHFKQQVIQNRLASRDARLTHKTKWDSCWALFNNQYDFTKKADWQSKGWIPKVPTMVRATAALIETALFSSAEYGTIDGVGELSKAKAPMLKKLVMRAMEDGKFVNATAEAIAAGLLTAGVNLKIYPKSIPCKSNDSKEPGAAGFGGRDRNTVICFEPVSEYFLYRDPTGSGKWIIHDIEMDLSDLKAAAQDPKNGYDPKVVEEIESDFIRQEDDFEKKLRAGQTTMDQRPPYRKRVQISELWGEILNQDGTVRFYNGTMSVANEKYLIRPPMANPYRHQKCPILSAFPNKVPFSVWHEAYVYGVSSLALMITETFNLTMDANLYDSLRAFQIELDFVAEPEELANGIYPGKAIKSEGANGRAMIQPLQLGGVSQSQEIVYQAMTNEFNNGAQTNEFTIPQLAAPRSRRVTKGEVDRKSSQADLFSNQLAQTIERELIEPALDLTLELITQYFDDFWNPEIMDLLGSDALILQMAQNDQERQVLLGGNFKCRSRAITGILKKTEKLQKMKILFEEIKEFPEVLPLINPIGSLKTAAELLDLDIREFMNLPPDQGGVGQPVQGPSPLAAQLLQHRLAQGQNPLSGVGVNPVMRPQDDPMMKEKLAPQQALGGLAA